LFRIEVVFVDVVVMRGFVEREMVRRGKNLEEVSRATAERGSPE